MCHVKQRGRGLTNELRTVPDSYDIGLRPDVEPGDKT